MSELRSLDVSFVDLNQSLTELHSLPLSLERLQLNMVPVQRKHGPPSLALVERLTRLRVLEIRRQKLPRCQCSDEFFARSLARLSRLEALALSGFVHVGVLALSATASLPRMR